MDTNELLLDALSRILKLEKEVEKLNQIIATRSKEGVVLENKQSSELYAQQQSVVSRDKTKYLFDNKRYGKNRLVLAVVTDYVKSHNDLTIQQLKNEFDKSLQGSIGVVEDYEIAKKRNDYLVRFFVNQDELITLQDGIACVCSQWGVLNIPNFLKKAEQLGYHIEKIVLDN